MKLSTKKEKIKTPSFGIGLSKHEVPFGCKIAINNIKQQWGFYFVFFKTRYRILATTPITE